MNEKQISYKQELMRKSIHLCSLSIPLLYYFTNYETILYFVAPLLIITLSVDVLSKKGMPLHNFIYKYFGSMLREHEKKDGFVLNGASWVLISAFLIILIFPKILAVTSFSILIISDLSAALIGRRFGVHSLFDKSWEGTFAFFITASIIVYIYSILENNGNYFLLFGIISAGLTALTEAASKMLKIDDNISVPSVFSISMWLLHPIALNAGYPYLL